MKSIDTYGRFINIRTTKIFYMVIIFITYLPQDEDNTMR